MLEIVDDYDPSEEFLRCSHLAGKIRDFWLKAGYKGIVAEVIETTVVVNGEEYPYFHVSSNLDKLGFPPKA